MSGSVVKPGKQFRGVWNKTTSVRKRIIQIQGLTPRYCLDCLIKQLANLYDLNKEILPSGSGQKGLH